MSLSTIIFSLVFWVLSILYIVFFAASAPALAAVFKLSPILVLLFCVYREASDLKLLMVALALGGTGDVLLAFGYFIPGLIAFLLGHLAYIALWLLAPGVKRWWLVALIILTMLVAAWLILPSTGQLQVPVSIYLLVISVMAIFATGSRLINPLGLLGVTSFLASDFILAWNEYVEPIAWSVPLVMGTYYLAQFSICRSVIDCHNKT